MSQEVIEGKCLTHHIKQLDNKPLNLYSRQDSTGGGAGVPPSAGLVGRAGEARRPPSGGWQSKSERFVGKEILNEKEGSYEQDYRN